MAACLPPNTVTLEVSGFIAVRAGMFIKHRWALTNLKWPQGRGWPNALLSPPSINPMLAHQKGLQCMLVNGKLRISSVATYMPGLNLGGMLCTAQRAWQCGCRGSSSKSRMFIAILISFHLPFVAVCYFLLQKVFSFSILVDLHVEELTRHLLLILVAVSWFYMKTNKEPFCLLMGTALCDLICTLHQA